MNKRPLPCVLAGFVLGEVWIWQFRVTAAFAALCFAAVICMMTGVKKKGSFFILFLLGAGMLAGGICQKNWNGYEERIHRYYEEADLLIEGTLEERLSGEYGDSFVLTKLYINGEKAGGKLLVYPGEEIEAVIGGRIAFKGQIKAFSSASNPGGFDLADYRKARGILGCVYQPETVSIRYGSFLVKDGIYQIRDHTAEYFRENLKESVSPVAAAMTLGEKGDLLTEQKRSYEKGGISHVLAVSGLHMSLLGAGIYKLFRKSGLGYGYSVILSLPCILVYAILTGMSSSCLRAGIMLGLYLIGQWYGYYYDLPSALSFAGLWLLAEIPARLFDSGFLLSFGAMCAVGILCPMIYRLFEYETGKNKIRDSFLSGLGITVFTLPLSLYFFYGISLAGLVLNIVVIPLMSVLVPLLFVGGLGWLSFVPDLLAGVCLQVAEYILDFYQFLCTLAEKFPLAYWQAGYRGLGFALGYYLLVFAGIILLAFAKKKGKLLLFFAVFSCAGILFLYISFTGRSDSFFVVLNVGQGDGMLYHSDRGEICMIDGGSTSEKNVGQYVLLPALKYYGISEVDYWFLSHLDEDHISGVRELLEEGFSISCLILPVREEKSEKQLEIEELARANQTDIFYMKQGDCLSLKEASIFCLHPKEKQENEDENQNSLVLLLETVNQQILLTGDVEKEGELDLAAYLKKNGCQNKEQKEKILKVSHHGSANGTQKELLEAFDADLALISCAKENRYGHPAAETVERLKEAKVSILYTMRQGAIEIRLKKKAEYYMFCQ